MVVVASVKMPMEILLALIHIAATGIHTDRKDEAPPPHVEREPFRLSNYNDRNNEPNNSKSPHNDPNKEAHRLKVSPAVATSGSTLVSGNITFACLPSWMILLHISLPSCTSLKMQWSTHENDPTPRGPTGSKAETMASLGKGSCTVSLRK